MYIKAMDAVQTYENMVRTSRMIYNDSVTKLNWEVRTFQVSMIAEILRVRPGNYMEEQVDNTDIPCMQVLGKVS